MEASRHYQDGHEIVLIGHAGHPEVIGTMGQLPEGAISLVEDEEDVAKFEPRDANKLAYITQTTLSVDDTKGIIEALEKKFPNIHGPHKEDICYATTNRQESVKSVAPHCDMVLVVGAPNSSNSQRLVEVAKTAGSKQSMLVQRAAEIDWDAMAGVKTLGITAGASAPEVLVNEVVDAFRARYNVTVETIKTKDENVEFKLPRQLRREGEPGAPVRSTTAAE
jgi:4-hydroxy-3-methylbut-2-enyl diphosphate reductase